MKSNDNTMTARTTRDGSVILTVNDSGRVFVDTDGPNVICLQSADEIQVESHTGTFWVRLMYDGSEFAYFFVTEAVARSVEVFARRNGVLGA